MAVWADLYDSVLPEVPGCTTTLADREIKNTVIDFMSRTGIERRTITNISHPGGASAISISTLVSATEQVIHVIAVWFNDSPLLATTPMRASPNWMTQTGTPNSFLVEANNLWLIPSPASAASNAIKVRATIAPSQTATTFPDFVMQKHHEDLALGAKARLLAKQKKPWTDQNLAAAYMKQYNEAVYALAAARMRGGHTVNVVTKGQFF